jgi:hypothetical protein
MHLTGCILQDRRREEKHSKVATNEVHMIGALKPKRYNACTMHLLSAQSIASFVVKRNLTKRGVVGKPTQRGNMPLPCIGLHPL